MLTFQDFQACESVPDFIIKAISEHKNSEAYRTAVDADLYDHQKNKTINDYVKTIWTMGGVPTMDITAANSKIASNFFHRLNTQRVTYLLGNGVEFNSGTTKDRLGADFDTKLKNGAYDALIHGVSFGFWNVDHVHFFPLTEFVPLYDEETGILRAGFRFWQLDDTKPLIVMVYEEDGFTKYMRTKTAKPLEIVQEKRAYRQTIASTEFGGDEVIGEQNYGVLPIIPLWGSKLHQSTLIGMQRSIDSYDLIRSGFANDLTDVAEIYWLIENAAGMDESDLAKFRDRLKLTHIATAETADGAKVTPYSQEIPYAARQAYLDSIRSEIYESFGALDVHTVAAGATNDHIDAAYQPMDEEADDFEFQIIEFIQQILEILGIEDDPLFKRNRISNQSEQTQMVLSASEYLDEETILKKLPFITVDEVKDILSRKDSEDMDRFGMLEAQKQAISANQEEEQPNTNDEEETA